MAFRGVDRERLAYLLARGTQEGELRRFFMEKQRQLLIGKARGVQNLPHGRAARIKAITERLPSTCDEVLRDWFGRNITMVDPVSADSVVAEFQLYEVAGETIPEDQAKRLARSALTHLFSDAPSSDLMAFLRSKIGSDPLSEAPPAPEEPDRPEEKLPIAVVDRPAWVGDDVINLIGALIENEEIGDLLDDVHPTLGMFVSGMIDALSGNEAAAKLSAERLPIGSRAHQVLDRAISRARLARDREKGQESGLVIAVPESYSGGFDADSDVILGYCTNSDQPRAVFIKPLAVMRDGYVQLLSQSDRVITFPESGDVISFAGGSRPRQPVKGEIGAWRVGEHDTEKRTRFHVEAEISRVYEVIDVPVHATDPDAVRAFIKSMRAGYRGSPLQPQLFALRDGLIIGPKTEKADLTRDESYESAFNAWPTLTALLIEGRTFVVGPLPPPSIAYDCSPLASTVRQLLRDTEKDGLQLTRAQRRDLIAAFKSQSIGVSDLRMRRVTRDIDRIVADQEAISEIVSFLLRRPEIDARISEAVAAEARSRTAVRDQLQGEIQRLTEEKGIWESKLRDLSTQHRKLSGEAMSVVKSAFDKAMATGVETLANAKIFQALAGEVKLGREREEHRTLAPHAENRTVKFAISDALVGVDAVGNIVRYGVGKRHASAIVEVVTIARECGMAVCFKGGFARAITSTIATATSSKRVALVDVGIGLTDDLMIQALVETNQDISAIVLLDANLSSIDLYGRSVVDHLVERATREKNLESPAILLSLSASSMAVPLPRDLCRLSVTIDLDRDPDAEVEGASEISVFSLQPEQTELWGPLWDRLCDRIEASDSVLRPTVAKLFGAGIVAN